MPADQTRERPSHRPRPAAAAAAATRPRPPSPTYRTSRARPSPTRSWWPTACVRQFGGLTAVDVEHIEIQRGAITALIGPNGAGKTTFFNLLTGFDQPDNGHLVVQRQVPVRRAGPPGRPAGHGAHLPADQGAVQAHRHREHAARRDRAERRERVPGAVRRRSGARRSRRSPSAPTTCSRGSSSTPSARTSPAA